MSDGFLLSRPRNKAFSSDVVELEQVGWQQRYICPAEGPGPWSFCNGEEAQILNANPRYELRPVFAPIARGAT